MRTEQLGLGGEREEPGSVFGRADLALEGAADGQATDCKKDYVEPAHASLHGELPVPAERVPWGSAPGRRVMSAGDRFGLARVRRWNAFDELLLPSVIGDDVSWKHARLYCLSACGQWRLCRAF